MWDACGGACGGVVACSADERPLAEGLVEVGLGLNDVVTANIKLKISHLSCF